MKTQNGLYRKLQDDYDLYCKQGVFPCMGCRAEHSGRVVGLQLTKGSITILIQCDLCATKANRTLEYRTLEYLVLRYLYRYPDDKKADIYFYFRVWRLAYLYEHLLKTDSQKELYVFWYNRINEAITNKIKVKKAKKYHNGNKAPSLRWSG